MNAASKVIKAFGSAAELARVCSKHSSISRSAVSRWPKPIKDKGLGGNIPSRFHRVILDEANARDNGLTASDLVNV